MHSPEGGAIRSNPFRSLGASASELEDGTGRKRRLGALRVSCSPLRRETERQTQRPHRIVPVALARGPAACRAVSSPTLPPIQTDGQGIRNVGSGVSSRSAETSSEISVPVRRCLQDVREDIYFTSFHSALLPVAADPKYIINEKNE